MPFINMLILSEIHISDILQNTVDSLPLFYPELLLAVAYLLFVLLDIFSSGKNRMVVAGLMVAIEVVVAGLILNIPETVGNNASFSFFNGLLFEPDGWRAYLKILFCLLVVVISIFSAPYFNTQSKHRPYIYASFLIVLQLGLHIMVMAKSMITIFLGIEMVSIVSYVLTYFSHHRGGKEAALKYIIYGTFASAILLYGFSLLYGIGLEATPEISLITVMAAIFIYAGVFFKITAFPFHHWAPDVYQGAPTPVAAFFSVGPKLAGMVVLLTVTAATAHLLPEHGVLTILGGVAIATLLVGTLAAMWQKNAKKLLAYSSIAHAGFLLIAVISFHRTGDTVFLFYAFTYLCMNAGAFVLVAVLHKLSGSELISSFAGLGRRYPGLGVVAVFLMISLTGLPPTAGFNAKWLIFSSLMEMDTLATMPILQVLLVVGLIATIASLYFYLKIPYYMFFRQPTSTLPHAAVPKTYWLLLLVLTLPLLVFFLKMDLLLDLINFFTTTV